MHTPRHLLKQALPCRTHAAARKRSCCLVICSDASSPLSLSLRLRRALPWSALRCREFCQAIRTVQPSVVVFTSVPIAGGAARAASPGQLAGAWQAAAILGGGRARGGVRTRELIQASVTAAVERARMELRSQRGQRGVVVVCGSLHAVGAALAQLPLEAC